MEEFVPFRAPSFTVRLSNISQELAGLVIHDIQAFESLKDVDCLYSGNYQNGTAEFIAEKRVPIGCVVPWAADPPADSEFRHVITSLCAALSQSIGIHITLVEKQEPFVSELIDQAFGFDAFNCISARLRLIDAGATNANCAICPFQNSKNNKCRCYELMSPKFNRILKMFCLDDRNYIEFSSRQNFINGGVLIARFDKFENLIHMLDLEQFLDINGLFRT